LTIHTLTTDLQGFEPTDFEWTMALYNAKKSKDGVQLDFGKCEMKDIGPFVVSIRNTLLEKTLQGKTLAEYSPFLASDTIGAMEMSNELVSEPVNDIFFEIEHADSRQAEDYVSGIYPSPTGYAFYGCKRNEDGNIIDKVLFIRRTSPLIKGNKTWLCTTQEGRIVTNEQPVLRFNQAVDLIIIGGFCYFVTSNAEKDLGLENRHFAICAKRMALIADKGLINNYDQLDTIAMKSKHARKFLDFDLKIIEHIERLPIIEREEFLSKYGITIDNEGLIDTDDPEQCELVIDLLCCRSCLDALGRLAVGNSIMPRE